MWTFISNFVLKNRYILIISILCVTAFMAYHSKNLQLAYAGSKVLPLDDPSYVEYNKFKEKFGEDGAVLVIGANDKNIWQKDTFNDWSKLSNEIKAIKGIQEVLSIGRVFELKKDTAEKKFVLEAVVKNQATSQAEVDSLKQRIEGLKFYDGLLFNTSNGATLMAITFDKQILNSKYRGKIVNQINQLAETFSQKHKIELHYSGLPWVRSKLSDKIAKEFVLFLFLALIATGVVLAMFFRQFHAVFFPLLVVINGVVWALGVIALFNYQISLLLGIVPALIVIIGIPNSVLLLNKYHNEFKKTGDKMHSLKIAVQKIGPTALLANVSAAIGFGVFSFTNSAILTEFGHVAAINIIATYICSMILVPIIFSFLPAPSIKHTRHLEAKRITAFLTKIDYLVFHHRKAIYITSAVIVAIALFGVTKMRANGFVVDDLPKNDPIYKDLKFFEKNFDGILPLEVSIDTKKKNGVMNASFIHRIDKFQNMVSSYPEISRALSLDEVLKMATQGFYNGNPAQYRLPNSMEQAFILSYAGKSSGKGSGSMLKAFLNKDKSETRISFQMADIGSEKMNLLLKELEVKTDSIFPKDKFDVVFTGSSRIFVKGTDYLVQNLKESLLLAIGLISIIIFVLFRSLRMNGIALIPNIISLIFTAGIMGYAGINLKPSTILIFSVAFGLANDQTIYFLTKYRQELENPDNSISKAIALALSETGVSMIYAAGILFFGFGIFAASNFQGTMWLGILVSITLLVALLSNLILVPALLLSLEQRINRKKVNRPLIQMNLDLTENAND
ncbi:Fis family transcriptional regulator [Solitalea longa]|uniref:Fis family transcriptional regulator n=1 Tax=Solitalea longa TaxID=2079460 RepID=A0A2S4ZYJ5_9SPHI|nr:MMPL family transporter [Solitalea longa]POY35067.1 Fis family transcriptional regulator [Solitalea longa]